MPEKPIIVRAQPAGTRRLSAVPPPPPLADPDAPPTGAPTNARQLSGLNAFLDSARRQGAELIAVAREQAQAIAANAREQGFAAGYEDGIGQAEKATGDMVAFAERLAQEARAHRDETIAETEREIVLLSLQIAERVAGGAIADEPERAVEILRGALRRTSERRAVTVVCNPDDIDALRAAGPGLQATLGGLKELEFLSDRRIGRGGVIVRTEAGDIDATLASKLERLREQLLGEQGTGDAEPQADG